MINFLKNINKFCILLLLIIITGFYSFSLDAMDPLRCRRHRRIVSKKNHTHKKLAASFILNVPAYVPSDDEDDGVISDVDEQAAGVFEKSGVKLPDLTKESIAWPFEIPTGKRGIIEQQCIPEAGNIHGQNEKLSITQQMINKIKAEAFKNPQEGDVQRCSLAICLNRPRSLSSKKNAHLNRELSRPVEDGEVKNKKIGTFWKPRWERADKAKNKAQGNPPTFDQVYEFYHALKKYDRENESDFAIKFRDGNEAKLSRGNVPYRGLRERVKENSAELVREVRNQNPGANTYIVCCDSDTKNFNGFLSTYSKLDTESNMPIDVMATGYKFFKDDNIHSMLQLGGILDMKVREATAQHVQNGVYYPEPVLCIRVPENHETLPETFNVVKGRNKKNEDDYITPNESPIILNQVRNRENVTMKFCYENPLETTIPKRATEQKAKNANGSHNALTFTANLNARSRKFANWSMADLNNITKNLAQSHAHSRSWAMNVLNAFNTFKNEDFAAPIPALHLRVGDENIAITERIGNSTKEIASDLIERLLNAADSEIFVPTVIAKKTNQELWEKIGAINSKETATQVLSQVIKGYDEEKIDNAIAAAKGKKIKEKKVLKSNLCAQLQYKSLNDFPRGEARAMRIQVGDKDFEINGEIGNLIRDMAISLLSRLFKYYSPIDRCEASKHELIRFLRAGYQNTGDRISAVQMNRTNHKEVWQSVDAITSKQELLRVLAQLLKEENVVQKIDDAARASGIAMYQVLAAWLNLKW